MSSEFHGSGRPTAPDRESVRRRAARVLARRSKILYGEFLREWVISDEGRLPTRALSEHQGLKELQTLCRALGRLAGCRLPMCSLRCASRAFGLQISARERQSSRSISFDPVTQSSGSASMRAQSDATPEADKS